MGNQKQLKIIRQRHKNSEYSVLVFLQLGYVFDVLLGKHLKENQSVRYESTCGLLQNISKFHDFWGCHVLPEVTETQGMLAYEKTWHDRLGFAGRLAAEVRDLKKKKRKQAIRQNPKLMTITKKKSKLV